MMMIVIVMIVVVMMMKVDCFRGLKLFYSKKRETLLLLERNKSTEQNTLGCFFRMSEGASQSISPLFLASWRYVEPSWLILAPSCANLATTWEQGVPK